MRWNDFFHSSRGPAVKYVRHASVVLRRRSRELVLSLLAKPRPTNPEGLVGGEALGDSTGIRGFALEDERVAARLVSEPRRLGDGKSRAQLK